MSVWPRRMLSAARLAFTPVALAALAFFAWHARNDLDRVLSGAVSAWLALAVFAWVALHFAAALFTTCVLGAEQPRLNWRTALIVHGSRLPARYLPGGIWHAVARATDYSALGVPTPTVVRYLLIEQSAAALVPLALGAVGLVWLAPSGMPVWLAPWIAPAALVAGTGLLVSAALVGLRPEVTAPMRRLAQWGGAVAAMVVVMALGGVAFACFLRALPVAAGDIALLDAVIAWVFGWAIGFLAVFAPQGIGVTETITAAVLDAPLGLRATAVVLASFRVVVLVADLLVTALACLLRRR